MPTRTETETRQGRVTILAEVDRIETRTYDLPEPAPGEVLLEMIRANVCGSDVHVLHGRNPTVKEGRVMGHEGVGRVAELGPGITADSAGEPLAVGDRVVCTYYQACRHCPECFAGDENVCRNAYLSWGAPADDAPHFTGTFSTHYLVRANHAIFRVPEELSSKAVSFANCALSQVYQGCLVGEVAYGDKVLILGAGGLGVCASAIASTWGAEVWVAEMAPQRLEKVAQFGAHHTIDLSEAEDADGRIRMLREATRGGADIIIDLTGAPSSFSEAARSLRPGGVLVEIGNVSPGRVTEIDPGLLVRGNIQIRATIRYPQQVLGKVIRFIAETPQFPWEELVDRDFTMDEIPDALAAAEAREVTRAGIVIGE